MQEVILYEGLSSTFRLHSWAKPYECNQCKKFFLREAYYTIWDHTWENPYKCNQFRKAFSLRGSLVLYYIIMKVHSAEKPYECDDAVKGFAQKSQLVKHPWIHPGEKLHYCEQCKKSSSEKPKYQIICTHVEEAINIWPILEGILS